MISNGIAKLYDKLTPEERFRLILAASDRGDEAERERLSNASKRVHFSMADHSPYARAFYELLILTYIDLLDDAASYLACNQRFHHHLESAIGTQRKSGRIGGEDAVEYPNWHHTGRAAYGLGFQFKEKMDGWKLFCTHLNVSPALLWEKMNLPGLDRIKEALVLAYAGAAYRSAADMAIWVNEIRPADFPEQTETDMITAERFAADLDMTFRERVR